MSKNSSTEKGIVTILLFVTLLFLVQASTVFAENENQQVNSELIIKIDKINVNITNLTTEEENSIRVPVEITQKVSNMNASVVLPHGLKPKTLDNKVVQAKFNKKLANSTSYDIERNNITWAINDEEILNSAKQIEIEFNVSATNDLQANSYINITFHIRWYNDTQWRDYPKHVKINILKAEIRLERIQFENGNLTIKLKNDGNGSMVVKRLDVSLSPKIFNYILEELEKPYEFRANSSWPIVLCNLSASELRNLNKTNPVTVKVRINDGKSLSSTCRFDISMKVVEFLATSEGGINQTLQATIEITGNESLKLLLNNQNQIKIKVLSDDCFTIRNASYKINSQNEKEIKKMNDFFVISNSNITIPSSIIVKISGSISKSCINNPPRVTLWVNLSDSIYDSSSTSAAPASMSARITVTPIILYCEISLTSEGNERENGTLKLLIGSNEYNVNIINNVGKIMLWKEAFWPIGSLKVETGNFTTSKNITYYVTANEPCTIYTGFLSVFTLAVVIIASTILWVKYSSRQKSQQKRVMQTVVEEEEEEHIELG